MVTIKHTRTGIQKVQGERKKGQEEYLGEMEPSYLLSDLYLQRAIMFFLRHMSGSKIFEALRVHAPRLGQAG